MKKFLKNLIPVNINRLVLVTDYYEVQLESGLLSLQPERFPNARYYVCLFKNRIRQPIQWELSSIPHRGVLRHGGHIPYHHDERYFVIGTDGKRYAHLFIDPDRERIGVRTDFFRNNWQAYGEKTEPQFPPSRQQMKKMEEELFGEKDEFLRDYKRRLKASYLGM
jgi:hypothetical protein